MNPTRTLIVNHLRRNAWLVAGGLAAIVCLEALILFGPRLIKQAVDLLAAGPADGRELSRITGALVAIALAAAVLRAVGRPVMMAFGRTVERGLRAHFFRHVVRLPQSVTDRFPAGDIMARATYDIDNIQLAAGYGFQAGFTSLLTLVISLAYMVDMSPLLTLLAAVPMGCIPWLTRRQSVRFHDSHQAIQHSFALLTEACRDSLNAIRLIKVYDLSDIKSRQFQQTAQVHLNNNLQLAQASALYLPVMTLITHLSQAIVWGCGGAMAVLGAVSAGDIVAFSAYLVMLRTPLVYTGYLINLYQRAKSSSRRLNELLCEPAEPIDIPPSPMLGPSGAGHILVKDLSFTYPGETRPALENIHFEMTAGTTHGLVGTVGSGKSTLLKLLNRIHEPPEGTIFVDGVDITHMPIEVVRGLMETVAQDPFVFSDSIRENLLLADPNADDRALWRVLEAAGLSGEVRGLTDGLDSLLGEKGVTFSGGQKARLCLARGLLGNRRIFLMDDPLSVVDTRAEALILGHLERLRNGRTHLIVSHRPLSLFFCDTLHVLDKGCQVAQGDHETLMAQSALYRRLVQDQRITAQLGDGDGGP